jgi:hypothetical protein
MAPEQDSTGQENTEQARATGYHGGDASAVISVEEVTRQAQAIAVGAPPEQIAALANNA